MTNFMIGFSLFVAIGGVVTAFRWRKGAVELSLLLLLASSQSAIASPDMTHSIAALGASDNTINQEQKALEESLKLDPTGDHYKGIEYSTQAVQQQPSDQDLVKSIKSKIADDNVVIAVSNGSARLSGRVKDQSAAKEIVELVKETAGIHEVSFDLGLAKGSR